MQLRPTKNIKWFPLPQVDKAVALLAAVNSSDPSRTDVDSGSVLLPSLRLVVEHNDMLKAAVKDLEQLVQQAQEGARKLRSEVEVQQAANAILMKEKVVLEDMLCCDASLKREREGPLGLPPTGESCAPVIGCRVCPLSGLIAVGFLPADLRALVSSFKR